ncbi:SPOR domain-containing protein [Maribacter confluentis]|uniref:SPOR domain-containing protein n=1 Tax=Maribacter confluentis TaxID=1656093 RepID=A0ABT8RPZ7_9FLAO|nr:SPOR domain-containing protein [Maribacter confluentis]MDO1512989.1 SPOR domain-containing protein [Maribacter confluentis]
MVLEHYISDLLYRYNCVVVPGFGAFLTQRTSAKINQDTNTFFAPTKLLAFNGQLTSNDGLLASYISETDRISFEVAHNFIEEQVKKWERILANESSLLVKNIGVLSRNNEGSLLFQPASEINYLTSSFGLSNFSSLPITREVLKEEIVELEENIPLVITSERRQSTGFRPYLKYAAVLLLAFSTGLTAYKVFEKQRTNEEVARTNAREYVTKQIQEATFFDLTPLELPTVTVDATNSKLPSEKEGEMHHIIAGAFRIKANAERKIEELKAKGYNSTYYGTNNYGLHVVTYESFSDATDALNALKEIKRVQSKDAWLLSKK